MTNPTERSRASSGVVVGDRFVVERVAGTGATSVVLRAFDREGGVPVALKVQGDRGDAAHAAHEARVLASLDDAGIVKPIAHGVMDGGEPYVALEWLEGETLGARLARGPTTIQEAVALGVAVADALGAAHARGVVHRDVKPSNVFLVDGRFERAKVVDFGAAIAADDAEAAAGELVGTPGYIAPEQARGERVDARADVFSLGCVLFRCLAGRPAFAGDDPLAVLLKVALDAAPRLGDARRDVPEELDELVARMLTKAPAGRPADGAAVARELRELASDVGAPSRPSAPPSRPALTTSEQRVLSLVVARVPERARAEPAVDQAAIGAFGAAAARFGGQLVTLGSGRALVVFGGWAEPSSTASDHARRAASSALAMHGAEPEAAIVVASGRAVVAGSSFVGDALDRGGALLAKTPAGGVRLDDVTLGLIGSTFVVAPDDAGALLVGTRDVSTSARTLLGRVTPCVGRARELAILDDLFDACVSDGAPRAALVVGAPGVGKSRLRWEFLARAAATRPDAEVWIGRGDLVARGGAYAMLGAAIRRAAEVVDGEPAEASRAKLRARVARHVAPLDVARVTVFLGELVAVPFPDGALPELAAARREPILLGDQMRRAWEDFLAAEAGAAPVILVLDDLHWADVPTVALVGASLANLRASRLFVVALARPEVSSLFPNGVWGGRATVVRLGELEWSAAVELARAVLGEGASEEVVAAVVERSGGNVFYLEELLRVAASGGRELPEAAIDVAASRLEAQRPEARRVLRAASVFGGVFWEGGVLALLGGDASEIRRILDALAADELIEARDARHVVRQREFAFRHALLHEAAHAALTAHDAATGHRLAGAWLEAVGERDAAVLAEHFERGGDLRRASAAYRRAAEQALLGNDFVGALSHAARCRACGAAGEDLGGVEQTAAEAHLWRGENVEALRSARAALAALPARELAWYGALAQVATAGGRLGDQQALLEVTNTLLASPPERAVRAAHVVAAARAAARLLVGGSTENATRLLDEIERVGQPVFDDDPVVRAAMSGMRAIRALWSGDPSGYLVGMASASAAYDLAGDRRNACMARVNMGSVLLEIGDHPGALAALEAGLVVAERLAVAPIMALARCNVGLSLARLGRVDDGARVEAEAIAAFAAQGDRRMEGACRIYLAAIHQVGGDLMAAAEEAARACAVLVDAPPTRACALARLGSILLQRGDAEGALAAAREATTLLDALQGTDEGEALARLVHAEALHATGDVEVAARLIAEARDRVLERADRITRPAWRESFLAGVPENARTLELAAAWCPAPP